MTPHEYLALARRTAVPHPDFTPPAPVYYHWFLGLVGELGELVTCDPAHFRDEVGDFFWYLVNFCDAMGIDPVKVIGLPAPSRQDAWIKAYIHLSIAGETLKKLDWYMGGNKNFKHGLLIRELELCVSYILVWVYQADLTLDAIFEYNIAKLESRYPTGFNG